MFRTTQPRRGATTAPSRRRVVSAFATLALGVTVLSGCAAGQISQTADQVPNQDAAVGTVGVIGVNGFTVAGPSADAPAAGSGIALPSGTAASLDLWVTNDSNDVADTLTGITTPAGTVTITGDATIEPQSFLQIGGDGAVTATVELTQPAKYGVSIPFTFSFAKAGELSLNATVAIPQERATDRSSTAILPPEHTSIWSGDEH